MFKTSTIAKTILTAMLLSTSVASAEQLRLSHQWSNKDVRHQVAQMVADEVAAASVEVFKEAGVEIAEMTPADFEAWRAIAQETSYKKIVSDVPGGQELLDLALAVE